MRMNPSAADGVSRRTFLARASLAVAISGRVVSADSSGAGRSVVVRTPLGMLRGEMSESVRVFRGIRFVEPPVGELRFRPPVPISPWRGERDATKFTASPMQPGEAGVRHDEDCLGLNVWAPVERGSHPVFVWIHGGGYTAGHAFDSGLDGAEFARQGIVCVTVPYRLGVFGFLDVGPLVGAKYAGGANNAVRDLIAALEWVRENISSFGGDPDRVTIGGESAGGKLTDTLMGVPSARPLFQQMISSSGGAERLWNEADAAFVSRSFGDHWRKVSGREPADLLTAPATELVRAQQSFLAGWSDQPKQIPLRPEIDGDLIPRFPIEAIAAGSSRGKRLLIGTNLDESALMIGPHPGNRAVQSQLGNVPLSRFNEIYARYPSVYPEMNDERRLIRAVSAQAYWVPSVRVADAHVRGGRTAWMYRLDFAESGGRLAGYAYHSLDVGMVWNRPHRNIPNASAEAVLSRQTHEAWVAFLRGRAPAAQGLPAWPEYDADRRPTMILNTRSEVVQRPDEAELRLWDGVL